MTPRRDARRAGEAGHRDDRRTGLQRRLRAGDAQATSAEARHISKISDLKTHPDLRAGPTPEFLRRQDGWKPLVARYGLHLTDVRGIEHGLGYTALASGQIDLKDAYTTDAKIARIQSAGAGRRPALLPAVQGGLPVPAGHAAAGRRCAAQGMEGTIDEERMIALNAEAEEDQGLCAGGRALFLQRQGQPARRTASRSDAACSRELPRLDAAASDLVGISLLAGAILVGMPLGICGQPSGPGQPGDPGRHRRHPDDSFAGAAGASRSRCSASARAPRSSRCFSTACCPSSGTRRSGCTTFPQPLREVRRGAGPGAAARSCSKIYLPLAVAHHPGRHQDQRRHQCRHGDARGADRRGRATASRSSQRPAA